ncbi:MAG: hypothetical protein JJE17_00880 [Peptostreptococcaceae bacterium]|nr:hypothetical protein [Peptostreptococcaceae bacterium]
MINNAFTSILSIPNFDKATTKEAESIFNAYKKNKVILNGYFDDNVWHLCDEYSNVGFDFNIKDENFAEYGKLLKIDKKHFIAYMKTYIIYQLGELVLLSLQQIINGIKKVVSFPVKELTLISEELWVTFIGRIIEFFSMLPDNGNEDEVEDIINRLEKVDDKLKVNSWKGQRKLASFDSYFLFSDILDQFWNESRDEEEKLFFFPVYLWWKVTGVIPMRPREFVVMSRDCLKGSKDKWILTLRKDRLKGPNKTVSYKIDKDFIEVKYQIPNELADTIMWYKEKTDDFLDNELGTLFLVDTHYVMWGRCKPYTSRYFTYANFGTCLRYFFQQIIQDRYGYRVIFERKSTFIKENEIQYICLGDTRHLSLINMIAEGATPMVAMMLAGHDNPNMSSHYYSNITNLIECKTYRQYKRLIKGEQTYSISQIEKPLHVSDFVPVEPKGRCYSPQVVKGIFTDCMKIIGPESEIGYCPNCTFYRAMGQSFTDSKDRYKNQINMECKHLDTIVKKVRQEKGYSEELVQALMKLKNAEYTYQQYLKETMEMDNGKN